MAAALATLYAAPAAAAIHHRSAFFGQLAPEVRGPKAVAAPRAPARAVTAAKASMQDKIAAAAVAAALVLPDVAEAAQPGLSPSLKNFLLSILSGGVVLGAIVGAVVAVANFDPVKRA